MKQLAAILAFCIPLIAYAQPKDKEAGCKQDKEKMLAKVESRVKEMRAARKTECEIWTEVGGLLARS